uniref:DUF4326 domain-containing protein n=1 Tax=Cyanoptyche gloeocystis TaxID=77922 RepID=A0A7S2JM79_9EUKA
MVVCVVNVHKKDLNRRGIANLEEWKTLANSLYIGRSNAYVRGATKSKWANPYAVKKYGLQKCLEMFEDYARQNLWDDLEELQGKELGCWCSPSPCHGDVLLRLLREKQEALGTAEEPAASK